MTQGYKKTDRVRKTASHERLEAFVYGSGTPGETGHIPGLVSTIQEIIGRQVDVVLTRSEEQRYARALFDLDIGGVLIKGKTAEDILQVVAGVMLVREIQTSDVVVSKPEIEETPVAENPPEEPVAEKPPVKVRTRKPAPPKKIEKEEPAPEATDEIVQAA